MSTAPFSTVGLRPSFGFGDRLGLATPGHVQAMRCAGAGVVPIYAQQSIRELQRTGRTPQGVVRCAIEGMQQAGWTEPSGADADHLKTRADVDHMSAAGFTFFTIDPSDHVDVRADDYDAHTLNNRFEPLQRSLSWIAEYVDRQVALPGGRSFVIDRQAAVRCAVKYGQAIERAIELAHYILEVNHERQVELELSVDETPQPTSLAEHFIIADQFRARGVSLISLAPRFIGDFEKGIDYKGDLTALERSLADHAVLAERLGPYKLSLHSGSDKLSIYSILARTTRGRFHVKTAGTSYLEVLRVVARHDGTLFRRIIDTARAHFDNDRATYHVSAELSTIPPASDVSRLEELERIYLGHWGEVPDGCGFANPARQILHCTFGTVLTQETLGSQIRQLLKEHASTYDELLAEHFTRHLKALQSGL